VGKRRAVACLKDDGLEGGKKGKERHDFLTQVESHQTQNRLKERTECKKEDSLYLNKQKEKGEPSHYIHKGGSAQEGSTPHNAHPYENPTGEGEETGRARRSCLACCSLLTQFKGRGRRAVPAERGEEGRRGSRCQSGKKGGERAFRSRLDKTRRGGKNGIPGDARKGKKALFAPEEKGRRKDRTRSPLLAREGRGKEGRKKVVLRGREKDPAHLLHVGWKRRDWGEERGKKT